MTLLNSQELFFCIQMLDEAIKRQHCNKMKTFQEFLEEAYLIEANNKHGISDDEYAKWKNEVASHHTEHGHVRGVSRRTFDGVEYEMRSKSGKGKPKVWAASKTSDRKASAEDRNKKEQETKLTYDELLTKFKGDKERAAAALDAEETGIRKVVRRKKGIQKATGVPQSLGHKQPLRPDDPKPEDPGHTRSNIQVEPLSSNTAKKNRRPNPGESGYGLTRAQSTTDAVRRGDTLLKRVGDLVTSVQSGKSSRPARLLSYLRRPKPKISAEKSAEKSAELRARMAANAKARGFD